MTEEEFKPVAGLLNTMYSEKPPIPNKMAFECWFLMLQDKPVELVQAAANMYVATNHFPPKVSDILEKIQEVAQPDEMTELAAWALVSKAIANSNYNAEKEFEKLPPEVQIAVGNPANLREMAQMPIDTVNSVEQSHFIRSYRAAVARSKQQAAIPTQLKTMIANTQNKMLEVKD